MWTGSTNTYFWLDPVTEFWGVLMVQARPFGHLDLMSEVHRAAHAALEPR